MTKKKRRKMRHEYIFKKIPTWVKNWFLHFSFCHPHLPHPHLPTINTNQSWKAILLAAPQTHGFLLVFVLFQPFLYFLVAKFTTLPRKKNVFAFFLIFRILKLFLASFRFLSLFSFFLKYWWEYYIFDNFICDVTTLNYKRHWCRRRKILWLLCDLRDEKRSPVITIYLIFHFFYLKYSYIYIVLQ